MRIIFMGSPEFAIPSLRSLADAHDVVAVYSQPDRIRGRGRHALATPVKAAALELGVEVRTPETLRDSAEQHVFAAFGADVACVAAYGLILPPPVLDAVPFGCVNVHASLLPRHRGAAPVQRAILEGDRTTGVSIMRMEEGLDTGPYASVRSVEVGDLDASSLTEALAVAGAEALLETLAAVESGAVVWTPQDEGAATYAAKIADADVALDPSLPLVDALRRIRASGPSARSKVIVCDTVLDIIAGVASAVELAPGEALVDKRGVHLGVSDGTLSALEVRPQGRASMCGTAFACGIRGDAPMTWETV